MHLDWAPPADAGTGRPEQWQNVRCLKVQGPWGPCFNAGSKNVECLKGDVPPPNETAWSDILYSSGYPAMQHLIGKNRLQLSIPFASLFKVDARVCVCVCNGLCVQTCVQPMWHLTCTQHAACRDSCDNPILVKSSWTSVWLWLGSLSACVSQCDSNWFRQ